MASNPLTSPDADPRHLAERLRMHVDRLAGLIGPRHLGKPVALEAAATYIEREFQAFGSTVERQWYETQGQQTCNIVVERLGTTRPRKSKLSSWGPTTIRSRSLRARMTMLQQSPY